jgi:DNA replication licensing factor MCM5
MKKYIQYCKARCSPRLSEEAGEVLTSSYVKIRDGVGVPLLPPVALAAMTPRLPFPTVRQLERWCIGKPRPYATGRRSAVPRRSGSV